MKSIPNNILNRERLAWLIRRLAWAVLCCVHAVWVVKLIGAGDASAFRLVSLALGVGFLALKTIDVPWLRMLCTRRAMVAGVLIVVILHIGVMDRTLLEPGDLSLWFVPGVVAISIGLKLLLVMARRIVIAMAAMSRQLQLVFRSVYRELQWRLAICGSQFLPCPLRVLRGPPLNIQ